MRILIRWATGLPAQLLSIVLFSVLALLVIVALGGVSIHDQAMRSLIGERDLRATRAAAVTLSERLDSHLTLLQTLAAHAADGVSVEELLTGTPVHEAFDYGLVLLDEQRRPVWRWQPYIDWSWDELASSPLQLHHSDEHPFLVAAHAESIDGNYRLLGAFSLSNLDVAGLLSPLRTSEQTVVLLVGADGHVLFHSEGVPFGTPLENEPGVRLALDGESGAIYTTDDDGGETIVTFSPISLSGWGLVVHEPWEQVASTTLRLSENTPFILLAAVVLTMLALTFGVWRIVRPLQHLGQRASRLAWGDYETIREPVGGIPEISDLQQALIRMAQRVQQAEHARQSYIGAITRGQEEERARLARELHDDTVQALIALGQRIQMAEKQLERDPDKVRERLAELRTLANQTLDDVRRLIRDMRPTYLEDLGLIPALQALCADYRARNEFSITIAATGSEARLAPDVEVALYRIAQEALSNVSRHAKASHVDVQLFAADSITLTIEDNGCGFEVPAHPAEFASNGHYGLMTMAERGRLVGGTFLIKSESGQGTRLKIQL